MPNSLKSRLKKLKYQGLLSEKDLSRIYTDNDMVEELEEIKAELENPKAISMDFFDGLAYAEEIIDKHIAELKGENNG